MLRSPDGRSMMVTFDLVGNSNQAQHNVKACARGNCRDCKGVSGPADEEFGAASSNLALIKAYDGDFSKAEHSSLPITLIILLLAFGALVAAGVPLLLGMTAVLGALGLIAPLSHLIPVAQGQIAPVVLLIGLAVGVDYSMFYLRRKLEERRADHDNESTLARAASTSGRAVLISGLTVLTAMAGMFLAGNAVFTSLAMGTMVVVVVAVIGSLTVLPAVMSKLGDNIEKGHVPSSPGAGPKVRLVGGDTSSTGCCGCQWSRQRCRPASSFSSPYLPCGCTPSTRALSGCPPIFRS